MKREPAGRIAVCIEVGKRRTFACALDWPGWCRSAKDEAGALVRLREYRERYAAVAERAGFALAERLRLEVVETLKGSTTTDFGVPAAIADVDCRALETADASRLADLVAAAWELFDDVVVAAPSALRKGPRGGGRDRDGIVRHVLDAETAYARKIGIRLAEPGSRDAAAIRSRRGMLLDRMTAGATGGGLAGTPGKEWPTRYAARRIAWHVLDHAWEIEDRAVP